MFVADGIDEPQPIASMPGVVQHTRDSLRRAAADAVAAGVGGLMLFGVPRDEDKDATGSAGVAEDGILNVALRDLAKDLGDDTVLMADTCLDEFTDHGHCGVLDASGRVDNDATNARYVELAVAQADSGAHVVGPSGMMDGQVAAIRDGLDAAGHTDVVILAYAAKFASAFYGPFREAVASSLSGDRRTYQQDPANAREAVHEIELDIDEGADIVMVKPAMGYLDVVRCRRRHLTGAGGRLSGLGRVLDDQRRGRQRLDRSADRGAGDADRHPARGRRHRADVLGGRRRPAGWRDASRSRAADAAAASPAVDVDTGFWLWVAALPLMVAGYVVDLVSDAARTSARRSSYAISAVFVVVIVAVVVTFLFLMRQGYRWARTLLTGGGIASVVYAGTSLFTIDRPTAAAVTYAVTAIVGSVLIAGGVFLLHRKDAHAFFTR